MQNRNRKASRPERQRRLRIERLEDRIPLDAAIGDMTRTTAAIDVRTQPGLAATEISANQYPFYRGSAPAGQLGSVVEGPRSEDARTWWRVDFGPGKYAGWVTEQVLTSTTIRYTRGIDVSRWQNQVNWASVKDFGIEFAFMKATESTDHVDPRFQQNVAGSRNSGVLVGFYHFGHPIMSGDIAGDARAEAAHFVNVAGPHIRAPGLPPVLDLENRGLDGQPPNRAAISTWARAWLDEVERLKGVRPMIYANSDWAKNYIEPDLKQYDLWHARWTRDLDQPPLPTDPGIWAPNWTFWQYSDATLVPGVAAGAPGVLTGVDGDVFPGSLDELQAWARAAVPDTIPPSVSGVFTSPLSINAGQPLTIRWIATDHVAVDHIGLYLYKDGMPVDTRAYVSGGTASGQLAAGAGDLPNIGSYSWTVPMTLPPGAYQIKAVAWDTEGNRSPDGPNLFSKPFTVSSPPLTAVAELAASAIAANQIRLSWIDSVVSEEGFYIERSSDGTDYTQVATLGPGATSYVDSRLESSRQFHYRIRAFRATFQGPVGNTATATTLQLTTITGTSAGDILRVLRSGTLLKIYENTEPIGQPTYSSEIAALGPTLTIDTLDGDDALMVNSGGEGTAGFAQLIYNSGEGANILVLQSGSARIDSTVAAGGTLSAAVQAGARLSTSRVLLNELVIGDNSHVTLLADGGTSVINNLGLGAEATLDITNNALVIDYARASPVNKIRQHIVSGRGGAGLDKPWNGAGITSSSAAQMNATAPNSYSLGYAENADLPLGAYTTFRGQPVDATSVLIAYARTGDANLDGVVDDNDVTVIGASYAPGVTTPVGIAWALGDFEYNGKVDDDDVTLLGVFYNPTAAPAPASLPLAMRTQLPADDELIQLLAESIAADRTGHPERSEGSPRFLGRCFAPLSGLRYHYPEAGFIDFSKNSRQNRLQ
ncbi:MAG: GH25 family lysozyme [Pirellulales bacterium]